MKHVTPSMGRGRGSSLQENKSEHVEWDEVLVQSMSATQVVVIAFEFNMLLNLHLRPHLQDGPSLDDHISLEGNLFPIRSMYF